MMNKLLLVTAIIFAASRALPAVAAGGPGAPGTGGGEPAGAVGGGGGGTGAVGGQSTAPAQGTVRPRHVMHRPHKMPATGAVSSDNSADMLNAKELAAIQHSTPAERPMPAAAPPKP